MYRRRLSEYTYRPAWWVPGPHAQTLWGKFIRRGSLPSLRVDTLPTPDGDVVELHRMAAPTGDPGAPRLFLLHGLEGTVRSHYVAGFFREAALRGWAADLMVFRGCGSAPNSAPRFYHSGETSDLEFALDHVLCEFPEAPLFMAGVSLGGNVLLKWLGERGEDFPSQLRAAAAMSVPLDLERGSRRLSQGFSRMYERHFLRSLRVKARAKLRSYPGLFDADELERARTLFDFDDAVTAPAHGFESAHDYYTRSSAIKWLHRIRIPTLLLNARDDPFLPAAVLDDAQKAIDGNASLIAEFVPKGGHAGFVSGRVPWRPLYYGEWRMLDFMEHAPQL